MRRGEIRRQQFAMLQAVVQAKPEKFYWRHFAEEAQTRLPLFVFQ
jgi:hypothetical protein